MFDFKREEKGSEKRFERRVESFQEATKNYPKIKHYGWWFLHNCVAHPWIGLIPSHASFEFHDWTSVRLNADHYYDDVESFGKFVLRIWKESIT